MPDRVLQCTADTVLSTKLSVSTRIQSAAHPPLPSTSGRARRGSRPLQEHPLLTPLQTQPYASGYHARHTHPSPAHVSQPHDGCCFDRYRHCPHRPQRTAYRYPTPPTVRSPAGSPASTTIHQLQHGFTATHHRNGSSCEPHPQWYIRRSVTRVPHSPAATALHPLPAPSRPPPRCTASSCCSQPCLCV